MADLSNQFGMAIELAKILLPPIALVVGLKLVASRIVRAVRPETAPAAVDAFASETIKVINRGFTHYSARTILHVIRHHRELTEKSDSGWKVNNNHSPYLGRLFEFVYPQHAGIFNHRATPAVRRETQEAQP
jgi:hypothetical protein